MAEISKVKAAGGDDVSNIFIPKIHLNYSFSFISCTLISGQWENYRTPDWSCNGILGIKEIKQNGKV